ncbi:hypothetical protein TanjilG_01183 [Lupinus angustifolius]|uniref:Uncharacterized protein n=1 Tax=Lupinus angustifolius TaxID=3871 RepID=A0A1J7HYV2_LUPAN|nr:hypothetical protein TanjilG_01183 [Lupinus angustifolius]
MGYHPSHFPRRVDFERYQGEANRKILDEQRVELEMGIMTLSFSKFWGGETEKVSWARGKVVHFDRDTINDYLGNPYAASSDDRDDFQKMKHDGVSWYRAHVSHTSDLPMAMAYLAFCIMDKRLVDVAAILLDELYQFVVSESSKVWRGYQTPRLSWADHGHV